MAQKFHRVRNGMADKDTLEVCFAIDSDEDRDVVAEVDNTEWRTSEDEVPPQVCKHTAKKSHMIMETICKRTTAFNAYCSEKRKENPNAGFRIQLWAREWQQLSIEAKTFYKEKAKLIGKKYVAVNCLRKIKKLINSLEDSTNDREAVGIEAIGLITLKNGILDTHGFGGLQNCLSDTALHLKLLGLSTGGSRANIKKSNIEELRTRASDKMSKIAKEQLGLNQFPYKRVSKGEFITSGIPPLLLPLRPAGKLTIKELEMLLAAHISISRAPAAVQRTDLPQVVPDRDLNLPQTVSAQDLILPIAVPARDLILPQAVPARDLNLPQAAHKRVKIPASKAENKAKSKTRKYQNCTK